jgi:hypothetical protein
MQQKLISCLSEDLRYKNNNNHPLAGFCYILSEAYFHLSGGKNSGLKPCNIRHEGASYWYLVDKENNIIDLTASQFEKLPNYDEGRGRGFLTKLPSKRAKILMERFLNECKGY